MPRPAQWFEKFDPITADFTYVRWLGDRKGIEEQTNVWDKIIVDRRADLAEWAKNSSTEHMRLCPLSSIFSDVQNVNRTDIRGM
jgi:hypothetical protein